ncbi:MULTISPECIES: hypothetical protein [Mesorhizobium]|uniref:hypothetical protein n=1 Tax=Mesorhizobium sp. 10.2.3 TaxID=1085775 RepID=UPI001FE5751E|nr:MULTISPECIES: hypothetical protein [Mesorhizobium]
MMASIASIKASRWALVTNRTSTSPLAIGATVLTDTPPPTRPTLSVMPSSTLVSACSALILWASSAMALAPSVKLTPECAALPVMSKR